MRLAWSLVLLLLPAAAPAELASPESALWDGEDLYVSNVGVRPAPTAVDGDGFIARLAPDGTPRDLRYLPVSGALNAPKGLARIDRTLYVADIDRVVGFDLDSREQVFELSLAETGTRFLNDLVVVDRRLLVSATDIGTVFEIEPATKVYRPLMRMLRSPNGLFYDPQRNLVFVAGYGGDGRDGELGVIHLDRRVPSYRRLGLRGRLDGIAAVGEWLLISDWGGDGDGRLHAVHPASGRLLRDVLTGLSGPADLDADPTSGRVWLPEMTANRLRVQVLELR